MSKNKKDNNKFRKFLARTFVRIGLALAAVLGVRGEMKQIAEAKTIEQDANLEVGRSFTNLDEENMSYYEKEYLDSLYEKYPNLDKLINTDDSSIQNKEFIQDMFNLYKIDFAGEKLDDIQDFNIDNLTIMDVDRLISQADRLIYDFGDEKKTLKETTVEKNKMITTKYLETMQDPTKARDFSNLLYEYLAEERGLDENIPTSKELDRLIDRSNSENSFRENLKYDIQEKEENETTNDNLELEDGNKDIEK